MHRFIWLRLVQTGEKRRLTTSPADKLGRHWSRAVSRWSHHCLHAATVWGASGLLLLRWTRSTTCRGSPRDSP